MQAAPPRPAAPPETFSPRGIPFRVWCPCGRTIDGLRQDSFQTVLCPNCRTSTLVYPISPLLKFWTSEPQDSRLPPSSFQKPTPRRSLPKQLFKVVLLLGLGCLSIVLGLYFQGWFSRPLGDAETKKHWQRHYENALRAWQQGALSLADEEWTMAQHWAHRYPGGRWINALETHRMMQRQRQARLLNDLCEVPLGELLYSALGLSDAAWQDRFRKRYQGRAILLDTTVHRSGRDGIVVDHVWDLVPLEVQRRGIAPAMPSIEVHWHELQLLQKLADAAPRRILFGARLASAQRSSPNRWVVRWQPDSGVLLTDREVLPLLGLGEDPETIEVLQKQFVWLCQMEP